MYLRRKIDDYLVEWKNAQEKKPLIIKGARQIGKTESVVHFAESYENFVNINFALEKKFKGICEDGYEVQTVIKNISRIDPDKKFIVGKTLILFDEIQDYLDIATSLKSFCIDGKYDVICSGSMLGINYNKIASNSVGYKSEYEMQSLDFEEFLWAKGYGEDLTCELLEHMRTGTPFNQTTMNVMNEMFLDFCILGGMPKVVLTYIQNKNFTGTLELQKELISDYKEDIKKYVQGIEKTKVLNVFNHIPVQLARENKKFQISKVASGAKFKDYWGCIEWLNDSGIINICYCLHTPNLPLKGNYEENKYKIYFRDTGILIANLDEESQEDLRSNKNMNVYKGALYENIVAEALKKQEYESQEDLRANKNMNVFKGALYENIVAEALKKQEYELFYYKRENATLEEDFFVRTKKSLVPVEVKSTNGTAKSLRTLIQSENYPDITTGIKFVHGNIGFANNIHTFPYFCVFLLKRYLKDVDF